MHLFFFIFSICLSISAEEYQISVFLGSESHAKHRAVMDYPFHVAFDSQNRMYVVEYDGSALDVLLPDGTFKKLGGNGTWGFNVEQGPVSESIFQGLHNIIIDDQDSVYITDTFNHRCRRYDPATGEISTYIGSGVKGFLDNTQARQASFNELYSIAFNRDKTEIVIADLKNRRVRVMNRASGLVRTIAGNGKKGIPKEGGDALKNPLIDPRAVAVGHEGEIYVADRGGHALRVIRNGKITTLINQKGKKGRKLGYGPEAQLFGPKYVEVAVDGRIWIADDQNDRICVYDPKTKQLSSVLGKDSSVSNWTIKRPHGLAFHKDGSVFIVDSGNDRVLKMVKK
jgi:sugar lactone lactonase YvrE